MKFTIEIEQEDDGRFIADVIGLPGVMVYGETPQQAIHKVIALALKVLAEDIEEEESAKLITDFSFIIKSLLDDPVNIVTANVDGVSPADRKYIFAFDDDDEIGNKMLQRISKYTGLKPEDLE